MSSAELEDQLRLKAAQMVQGQLKEGQTVPTMEWGRKRKECGWGVQKFSVEIAEKLININNRHWGSLSFKRLTSKLREEGVHVSPQTVRTWCKELQMQ